MSSSERVATQWLLAQSVSHAKSIALMKFLSGVARRAGAAEHVYVVGGAVRNFLIGQPIKDIDVVVDSVALGGRKDSEWFAQQVARAIHAPTNLTTNQYGVAILTIKGRWDLGGIDMEGEVIEVANARKESYAGAAGKGKGYKPTDVQPATIREDTVRREFTFNTLLWRLLDLTNGPEHAEVIDLTGVGRQHLEERLIQTPLDPDRTFTDDPTRMLRAVKFLAKYDLRISPDVAASIRRNAHRLHDMPWEAVGKILVDDILATSAARRALAVMVDLGLVEVLAEMLREKPFAAYLVRQLREHPSVALLLDLADLGLSAATPTSFLRPEQRARVREVTGTMPEAEARAFLDALRTPPVDNVALIDEFAIEPKERGILAPLARDLLLAHPAFVSDAAGLTDAVRVRLRAR